MIPAQELVEHGLAAAATAGSDGCVVLVAETSHADVRFATEHHHHQRHARRGRSVSVVACPGRSVGTASRSGEVGHRRRRRHGAGRTGRRRRRAAGRRRPRAGRAARRRRWGVPSTSRPDETGPEALDVRARRVCPAPSAGPEPATPCLSGFATLDVTTRLPGHVDRAPPGPRPAHRGRASGGAHGRRHRLGLGRGRQRSTPTLAAMEDEVWRRLDWGRRQIDLDAGRYEVILPPSGVADMMAAARLSGLGLQDAEDGRTVFSRRPGGRAWASASPRSPSPSTATPPRTGAECIPFVATGASWSEMSVFDNGYPVGRVDWLRGGRAGQPACPPGRCGPLGCRPWPPTWTTWSCDATCPGRRRSSRTWWRRTERGCCSRASGTSARSTRPPCSSPG